MNHLLGAAGKLGSRTLKGLRGSAIIDASEDFPLGMATMKLTAKCCGICARLTIFALLGFVLFSAAGCGGKKKASRVYVPPPPPPAAQPERPQPVRPEHLPPQPPAEIAPDAPVLWTQTGVASWYGPPYDSRQTASGEIYDQNALTAAHKTLPLNSIVRVTNLQTHHQVIVRITDRGPFIGDRIIDLSLASAKAVDVWRPGLARVLLEVLSAPAPIGDRWPLVRADRSLLHPAGGAQAEGAHRAPRARRQGAAVPRSHRLLGAGAPPRGRQAPGAAAR